MLPKARQQQSYRLELALWKGLCDLNRVLRRLNKRRLARLEADIPFCFFAPQLGGLLSYVWDLIDDLRGAANYADRILRGANPSKLPVQFPVKFELVINLKTAKALGLEVPFLLQQRAGEVIE